MSEANHEKGWDEGREKMLRLARRRDLYSQDRVFILSSIIPVRSSLRSLPLLTSSSSSSLRPHKATIPARQIKRGKPRDDTVLATGITLLSRLHTPFFASPCLMLDIFSPPTVTEADLTLWITSRMLATLTTENVYKQRNRSLNCITLLCKSWDLKEERQPPSNYHIHHSIRVFLFVYIMFFVFFCFFFNFLIFVFLAGWLSMSLSVCIRLSVS